MKKSDISSASRIQCQQNLFDININNIGVWVLASMSDGKATKTHFPSVKIDVLVTSQPGFVLTGLKLRQPLIPFLPLCLLIYAVLYKGKRRDVIYVIYMLILYYILYTL